MTNPLTPRQEAEAVEAFGARRFAKWRIYFDPPPIPARDLDWAFEHDDFDASWEGEEDGWVSNGLAGRGASIKDCLDQIDEIEDELAAAEEAQDLRRANPLEPDFRRMD